MISNCFFCVAKTNSVWCSSCEQDFIMDINRCRVCAHITNKTNICGNCIRNPPAFARTKVLLDYQYPANELIKKFKFNNQPELARWFANKLADKLVGETQFKPVLIPVPLHKERQRARGYNQSLVLATHLARKLALQVDASLCLRTKNIEPQSSLPMKIRKKNVKNAFALSTKKTPEHIVIVDDVITTGSTVNEIAKLLIKTGCKRVDIWAIARS